MAILGPALQAVFVLDVDPDLGGEIEPAERVIAAQACQGELLSLPRGPWPSAEEMADRDDLIAFVIVDGLLARELSLQDHSMVEFLGLTDVVPPPVASGFLCLGAETRLTAVTDLSLLVLGQPFVRAAARWPALLTALHRRLELQRESLALQGVIAQLASARHRVLLMLWHLGDRWGFMTPEGVVLPWPLSHEILGRLVGARRSTVTIALRGLDAGGAVHRRDDGSWLLTRTAEQMISAIARAPNVSHSVAERLMLYRKVSQTTAQSRALQAQARQIVSRRQAGQLIDITPPPH